MTEVASDEFVETWRKRATGKLANNPRAMASTSAAGMLRLIGRIDQLHQLVSDARTLGFRIGFVTGRDAARRKMLSEGQPGYAAEIEHIPIPPPPPERKEIT